ncbi:MAG: PEP/pyruvate-binding domain-containing protein [Chloroflexota bacterium]|jgi:pyruvate,water dikinase
MSGRAVPLTEAGPEQGGKAANLAWLLRHDYRVPAGLVVDDPDAEGLRAFVDPGRRYAVRSSASVEDSHEHSFAGQFATRLGLSGVDEVRAAIQDVIDSVHDERVQPYLRHAGVAARDIRMSVIVQEMVEAKASGVAFSRNPLTGLADIVIEAVAGTGQDLVAGRVSPERWVSHWGEWTSRPEASNLPSSVMEELAGLLEELAQARGEAVDVEWAWDGRALFLLQVRPMTVTDVPVYSNRLAREFLPGIVPPLVWSVNVPIVNRAWLELFESVVGPLDLAPEDLARQFAYRAYFNMGAIGDIFETMSMPRDLLEVLAGIEGGDDRPTFRPRVGVVRHLPRMTRMAWRVARYHHELDRLIPEVEREIELLERRDPDDMSDRGLLGELDQLDAIVGRVAFANILAPLLFSVYASLLRRRLERRGIDAHGLDLGAGDPRLEAYDPKPRLAQLAYETARLDEARRARVLAGEVELLPGGGEFMARFGHVSDSGNDFSHVPWREDPRQLAPLLDHDGSAVTNGNGEAAGTLPADLPRTVRIVARRTARYRYERERVSYTYTRSYGRFRPLVLEIARRLVERGLLETEDDVFYLTRAEMEAGLLGEAADIRELAKRRRAEAERWADVDMPEVIFGDEFEPVPPADPERQLSGVPSSRGVARATARVISGVGEAGRVQPGEIVVIPYSDVGWTPVLARAGGIVAESGGLLSHSSIVAREFGIPCAVSVAGAMRIPDGSVVRVDGFTGDVQWEPPAPAARPAATRS